MSSSAVISYLVLWGLVGCLLFSLFVILAFLQLPDDMGKESIKTNMLISIPVGLLIGAVLTLINTTISFILWIQ